MYTVHYNTYTIQTTALLLEIKLTVTYLFYFTDILVKLCYEVINNINFVVLNCQIQGSSIDL